MIRVAAAADIHASDASVERVERAFADLDGEADVVLLAGDLTTSGEPEQAEVLAAACRQLDVPIFAVLGNHDHHAGRTAELEEVLAAVGVRLLDRECATCEVGGLELGVVGTKGFVGGFPGSALPDFGEPLLRGLYAETSAEAEAIARGLQAIVHCDLRMVLLHYSPIVDTLEGEPLGIQTYLGCERLATPIAENGADLVLHGHAHAGSFEGCIGDIPVYNVAVHVTGRNFWIFELDGGGVRRGGEVVEVREPPQ
ncbi:MAG TPA: metallophosphoesterase [Gaiellaceae bacterium]|nr:metallophosphoesterase [Gaiellaceae bacterium]